MKTGTAVLGPSLVEHLPKTCPDISGQTAFRYPVLYLVILECIAKFDAFQVSGYGNVGLVFKGSETVDVGGLGATGGFGKPLKRWGAAPPTFFKTSQGSRGRPDPHHR